MKYTDIIFDLDGCLVNGSPDIVIALEKAFEACGIKPTHPITPDIIRRPLRELIRSVHPVEHHLDELCFAFKSIYDNGPFPNTEPYLGVNVLLHSLQHRRCYIATHKRTKPTMEIAKLFSPFGFYAYGCQDSIPGREMNKIEIVRELLAHTTPKSSWVMVGDSAHDREAAEENKMDFIGVSWGHGDPGPDPVTTRYELLWRLQ